MSVFEKVKEKYIVVKNEGVFLDIEKIIEEAVKRARVNHIYLEEVRYRGNFNSLEDGSKPVIRAGNPSVVIVYNLKNPKSKEKKPFSVGILV